MREADLGWGKARDEQQLVAKAEIADDFPGEYLPRQNGCLFIGKRSVVDDPSRDRDVSAI